MGLIQIGFVLTFLVVYETSGALQLPKVNTCFNDNECATGECCAKQIGPMIMSRAVHTTPDPATVAGKCQLYLKQKEWCGGVWRQNGQCGCDPALSCHWYPPTDTTNTLAKRKMLAGNYLCEPKDMPQVWPWAKTT